MIDWSRIPPIPSFGLGLYILVDREPVAVDDFVEMIRWKYENPELVQVGRDRIGKALISTVFLGMDQNGGLGKRPLLFETMIFGGPLDREQWRYHTYADAERGHAEAVAQARIAIAKVQSLISQART